MKKIKVFGHQSPDTDATVSAIVWAWFLNNHRKQEAEAYVLGKPNIEALFVLEKWDVAVPSILSEISKEDTIAIVDTNNADELFPNINDAEIIAIIDHHKLTGGLKTSAPLEVIIQPYASTMTVMFNVMNIKPKDFPKPIAGLMLSGILSDTLAFRSPTTTDDDKKLAAELAEALEINILEYANQMFEAKSNISEFSDEELIKMDSKVFDIKGQQLRISVIETTSPSVVLQRKDSLIKSIEKMKAEENISDILFFVVDILQQESVVLIQNDNVKSLIENGFKVTITGDTVILPTIVSRKKQIIPALS